YCHFGFMDHLRNNNGQTFTPQQAQSTAEADCAYQERSQQEVRDKLYQWRLQRAEVERVSAALLGENYLNEERFAMAYTSGRFRLKGWGKHKIKQGLVQKQVSPPLVRAALASLGDEEYRSKLHALLQAKARLEKEKHPYKRKNKL